jgi:hypothetical protein
MHNIITWLFLSGLTVIIAAEIAKHVLEQHRSHSDDMKILPQDK